MVAVDSLLKNENANPKVSIYAYPAVAGDVHGRIRIRRFRNRQNLVVIEY